VNIRSILGMTLFLYCSALFAFPLELSGTWVQPDKNESGPMFVHVLEHTDHTLEGVMEIRGSKDCPQPIAFRGTIKEKRVLIASTASIVCEHQGTLTGEVVKESEDVYTGTFRYTYVMFGWPITIASGGFTLVPVAKKE